MIGECRVCGCTDARPCILEPDTNDLVEGVDLLFEDTPTTCSWIKPDLCSSCAGPDDLGEADDATPAAPALIVDAYGNPWRRGDQ
jgi:hypothetical protein